MCNYLGGVNISSTKVKTMLSLLQQGSSTKLEIKKISDFSF